MKSSAYLQSWRQRNLSKPKLSGLKGRVLDEDSGTYSSVADSNAAIYAMCLSEQKSPAAFDPLDITMWKLFVVSGFLRVESDLAGVDLGWLERRDLCPVAFDMLKDEAKRAWRQRGERPVAQCCRPRRSSHGRTSYSTLR